MARYSRLIDCKGDRWMTTGRDREEELSKTLAVQHILDPKRENLRDVSNIPTGMVHAITSLGAYTTQIETLIKQIRARQYWYVKRQVEKEFIHRAWSETKETRGLKQLNNVDIKDEDRKYDWEVIIEKNELERNQIIEARFKDLVDSDKLDIDTLFISQLMDSYCHTSRGKNGLVLDKGTIMAEAEIQTRNPDNNNEPSVPRRS